jgi:hypothetical protein
MNTDQNYSQVQGLISANSRFSVLIAEPTTDMLAAGLSLALSLGSAGKEVSVFCSRLPQAEVLGITGVEKIQTELAEKDMIIALNYPLEKIDKVSSSEENNRLNLVVKVKSDGEPIRKDQVEIVPPQKPAQIGFVVGDEALMSGSDKLLSSGSWVRVALNSQQKNWATVNLSEAGASYSEQVAGMIQAIGLPFDRDIAKNLFLGIKSATNSFETVNNYRSFEIAALCFKIFQPKEKGPFVSSQQVPISEVENKEGSTIGDSGLPSPKIFKGATTPRV